MGRDGERWGEMGRDGERRWTNKPLEANHRISIGLTTVSALKVLSKGNPVVVRVVELDVCEDLREYNMSREFSFFLSFFIFHFAFFWGTMVKARWGSLTLSKCVSRERAQSSGAWSFHSSCKS